MKRIYLILIEPPREGGSQEYGVQVPDLYGCFSGGTTLAETLANAHDAVLLHVDALTRRKEPLPTASEKVSVPRGYLLSAVEVDLNDLRGSERINISVPKVLLNQIDRAAKRAGESRSGFLTRAAVERAKADA